MYLFFEHVSTRYDSEVYIRYYTTDCLVFHEYWQEVKYKYDGNKKIETWGERMKKGIVDLRTMKGRYPKEDKFWKALHNFPNRKAAIDALVVRLDKDTILKILDYAPDCKVPCYCGWAGGN
jgi:hypothetical protein